MYQITHLNYLWILQKVYIYIFYSFSLTSHQPQYFICRLLCMRTHKCKSNVKGFLHRIKLSCERLHISDQIPRLNSDRKVILWKLLFHKYFTIVSNTYFHCLHIIEVYKLYLSLYVSLFFCFQPLLHACSAYTQTVFDFLWCFNSTLFLFLTHVWLMGIHELNFIFLLCTKISFLSAFTRKSQEVWWYCIVASNMKAHNYTS